MPEPLLKYPTKCRMMKDENTPCGFIVEDAPLNVEIIGKPDARVQRFINTLMQHVQKKHPEALALAVGRSQMLIAYLTIGLFESQDPAIDKTRKQIEDQLRRDIIPHAVTDDEIQSALGKIGFTMEDPHREKTQFALEHLRDYYEGRIPKQAIEEATPLIVAP